VTAIVVTRAGKGEVYSFKTVLLADNHPITQFGDPIMSESAHLRQCLTLAECSAVANKIRESTLAKEIRDCHKSDVKRMMSQLWDSLEKNASPPPLEPSEVVKIITGDRIATRSTGIHIRPRGDFEMTEHAHQEATEGNEAAAATDAEVVKTKHRPIPKDPKYPATGVIKLLEDKEGKQFGADHNPKKAGSASADRFAKYTDGMTIEQARNAGILNGDFDNDTTKGFISVI